LGGVVTAALLDKDHDGDTYVGVGAGAIVVGAGAVATGAALFATNHTRVKQGASTGGWLGKLELTPSGIRY
jgi:hypothetical protein